MQFYHVFDGLTLDQLQVLGNALIFAGAAVFFFAVRLAVQIGRRWGGKNHDD